MGHLGIFSKEFSALPDFLKAILKYNLTFSWWPIITDISIHYIIHCGNNSFIVLLCLSVFILISSHFTFLFHITTTVNQMLFGYLPYSNHNTVILPSRVIGEFKIFCIWINWKLVMNIYGMIRRDNYRHFYHLVANDSNWKITNFMWKIHPWWNWSFWLFYFFTMYVVWAMGKVHFFFFLNICPFVPTPFVVKTVLLLLKCLGTFVENQFTMYVWGYVWTLFHCFSFLPIPHFLHDCNFL